MPSDFVGVALAEIKILVFLYQVNHWAAGPFDSSKFQHCGTSFDVNSSFKNKGASHKICPCTYIVFHPL